VYSDSRADTGGNWTIGTLPTMLSAQQLWQYSSTDLRSLPEYKSLLSAGAHWTLQTSQPVVMSVCSPAFAYTDNVSYSHVNGSTTVLHNATELYDTLLQGDGEGSYYMSWIQMPQEPTSLFALFREFSCSRPWSGGADPCSTLLEDNFTLCTVSPFWWETSTSLSVNTAGYMVQTDWLPSRRNMVHGQLRPITIDPGSIARLSVPFVPNDASDFLSQNIVTGFVAALSRVPGQDAYDGDDFYLDRIEGKPSTSTTDSRSYTPFRINSKFTGYGYGGTDTAVQLSLAVIIAYCLITVVYVTYIMVTGHTSIAWNTATELIMLALQSKEPDDLGYVSVGVDTMETLRRSVGIRVNTVNIADTGENMQKLELVFEHDVQDKKRTLKRVERNQAY
jgi:hypothetical protein